MRCKCGVAPEYGEFGIENGRICFECDTFDCNGCRSLAAYDSAKKWGAASLFEPMLCIQCNAGANAMDAAVIAR